VNKEFADTTKDASLNETRRYITNRKQKTRQSWNLRNAQENTVTVNKEFADTTKDASLNETRRVSTQLPHAQ
jgi:hypothetical protein